MPLIMVLIPLCYYQQQHYTGLWWWMHLSTTLGNEVVNFSSSGVLIGRECCTEFTSDRLITNSLKINQYLTKVFCN